MHCNAVTVAYAALLHEDPLLRLFQQTYAAIYVVTLPCLCCCTSFRSVHLTIEQTECSSRVCVHEIRDDCLCHSNTCKDVCTSAHVYHRRVLPN